MADWIESQNLHVTAADAAAAETRQGIGKYGVSPAGRVRLLAARCCIPLHPSRINRFL
jgi:hypothetical protein